MLQRALPLIQQFFGNFPWGQKPTPVAIPQRAYTPLPRFVGILDHDGLEPGIYTGITRGTNLPNPIEFYPEDVVEFIYPPLEGVPGTVTAAEIDSFEIAGVVRYTIDTGYQSDTKGLLGHDLKLVKGGNIRALYEGKPSELFFTSVEAEIRFWMQCGLSKKPDTEALYGRSLTAAWEAFEACEIDIFSISIIYQGGSNTPRLYEGHRVHKCFKFYQQRVRALTERYWKDKIL